jgi:hypothetical protein
MEPYPPFSRRIPKLGVEDVWRAMRAAVENPAKWEIGISWAFRRNYWAGRAAIARVRSLAVPALSSDEFTRYRFAHAKGRPHVALIAAIGLLPIREGDRPNLARLLRLADRIAARLARRPPPICDGSNIIPFPKRIAASASASEHPVPVAREPQQSA